jgi:hypothetical protein
MFSFKHQKTKSKNSNRKKNFYIYSMFFLFWTLPAGLDSERRNEGGKFKDGRRKKKKKKKKNEIGVARGKKKNPKTKQKKTQKKKKNFFFLPKKKITTPSLNNHAPEPCPAVPARRAAGRRCAAV